MKKMRKLLPAFAMLLVSAVMMSTASFAWFSMGTTASATGMEVKAKADSSLIISLGNELADFLVATSTVTLADKNSANGIAPATHDGDFTKYANGLKYISNADEAVDAGKGTAGAAADWAVATKGEHYVEYVVYIASAGGEITGKNLKVSLDIDAVTKNIHNALTVDFWVKANSAAELTYKGTINVDDTVDAVGAAPTVTLDSTKIPQAVEDGAGNEQVLGDYMTVVMRVYFDGELEDDAKAGYKYVRNAMVTETAVALGIDFKAE